MIGRLVAVLTAFISSVVEYVLTPVVMPLVDRNLMPDFIIRFGIRQALKGRLRDVEVQGIDRRMARMMEFVADLKTRRIAENTTDSKEQHYEVPTEFYEHVMGDYKKYSCGIWNRAEMSMSESELAALELVGRRAELQDGQQILDLGCGWGSFTLWAAGKYPSSHITCVSHSATQRLHIMNEARQRGLTNITAITSDVNDFTMDPSIQLDRVVSIEMMEHCKNYQELFHRISTWLKPEGKMFVHIFTSGGMPYHFLPEDGWMARTFFTGGTMPSSDLFHHFQRDLSIQHQWAVDGRHYARTNLEWLRNMDQNKAKVFPILKDTYPDAKVDPTMRFVSWRLFFMACEELFAFNKGQTWFVSHYLFENKSA